MISPMSSTAVSSSTVAFISASIEPALREHTRGLCADLADAEGAEQLGKIVLLGAVNGGDGVLRALEAHAVELCKRLYVETVKVGRLADKPGVHQLLEQRGADAVNVHRPREVKCVRLRSSCAGHSAPVQRVALSPSAR